MPTSVFLTKRAEQQVSSLDKRARRSYDGFILGLRAQGCAALDYRLSGSDIIAKICVAHLIGNLRICAAFSKPEIAVILLVAPHEDADPFTDVYSQLYQLAELDEPPAAERTKPPCCGDDDGLPPAWDSDHLEDLVSRARQLSGADKRRARRR